MNLAACARLPTIPITGVWYRAVQTGFLPTALSVTHTPISSSRFSDGTPTSPKFEVLYLAEDHIAALFEVEAVFGSPALPGSLVPSPGMTWTMLNVTVQLHHIADLTTVAAQTALATTAQELTGDWRGYGWRGMMGGSVKVPVGPAPTQELGDALYNVSNLEGFRTLSAKVPWRQSLVIFPQKLQSGSYAEWRNPLAGIIERLP